jgi:CopG family nickel-responsive transcriptional regulator
MQRITVTLDDALVAELDQLIAGGGYRNRSEALRDLARAGIRQAILDTGAAENGVAALVYVFDHTVRGLASQLVAIFHDNHDVSVASTEIPLNHTSGMAVAILKGPIIRIRALAERVQAERGVRHGRLVIVPAAIEDEHRHDQAGSHTHTHVRAR